jgi:hypothetical protein
MGWSLRSGISVLGKQRPFESCLSFLHVRTHEKMSSESQVPADWNLWLLYLGLPASEL